MHRPLLASWSCLLALVGLWSSEAVACASVSVQTSQGLVQGLVGTDTNRFVVPYALPPKGELRFADPVGQTARYPGGRYDATGLPTPCPQNSGTPSNDEDCLYATIYTPKGLTSASKVPVFVWVHGGSGIAGSSTAPGLDGSNLASSQNMIVVILQYRLGIFGFLKYDSIGVSGNYALKDIKQALVYIQSEISAFGGNPSKVTLAGQSSGAEYIKSLLVTPSATNYFQQAILQSAPLAFADQSPSAANAISHLAGTAAKCSTLKCLRARNVQLLLDAQSTLYDPSSNTFAGYVEGAGRPPFLRPVVDGSFVTRSFSQVVAAGGALEGPFRPLIFTTVKDEACATIASAVPDPIPIEYFEPFVTASAGDDVANLIFDSGLYDPRSLKGDNDATRTELSILGTDQNWLCANQQTAVNLTSFDSGARIYQAQFSIGISYYNDAIPLCKGKVGHEDDIYTLFGTAPGQLTAAQQVASRELASRWGAFAKSGSPNSASLSPAWNTVGGAANLNLFVLGGGSGGKSSIVQTYRPGACQVGTGLWGRIIPFSG